LIRQFSFGLSLKKVKNEIPRLYAKVLAIVISISKSKIKKKDILVKCFYRQGGVVQFRARQS